jgi:filamin
VSYTPTEEGEHEIDVKYDGTPLPDTPFPVNAERGCDPSKVKIFGDGLEKGIVDEVNTFVVETKNAGTGELVRQFSVFFFYFFLSFKKIILHIFHSYMYS